MKKETLRLTGKYGAKFKLALGQLTYNDKKGIAVSEDGDDFWDWDTVTHNKPMNCRKLAAFLIKAAEAMEQPRSDEGKE